MMTYRGLSVLLFIAIVLLVANAMLGHWLTVLAMVFTVLTVDRLCNRTRR